MRQLYLQANSFIMKRNKKLFWKAVAMDYAAPFIHPASYMLGTTGIRMENVLGVKKIAPAILENTEEENVKQRTRYCLVENSCMKHAKIVIGRFQKDPGFFKETDYKSRRTIGRVEDYALWVFRQNLPIYSDKKLISVYSKLLDLMMDMNVWGHVVNLTDFEHNMLTDKIMEFLEKKVVKNFGTSTPGVFAMLTTPVEKNPLKRQEIELYKLLSLVQETKKAEVIFRGKTSADEIIRKIKRFSGIHKAIKKYKNEYDWFEFHYSGPTVLGEEYFVGILSSMVRQRIKGKDVLTELRKKEKELTLDQKKVSKELKLSRDELQWINIAKTFMFLKALRKDVVFQASRRTDPLIIEISKRLHLTPTQTRNMTIKEIERGLKSRKVDIDIINDRINYSVWLFQNEKVNIFTRKQAKNYSNKIVEEEVDKKVNEFEGTPACIGQAKGLVKLIISADDIPKMNKGDILISPATNPNLLPAMKKAAAIITDEGGITCHAAIVSRELNIPCIIGTKIATKILKDGNTVKVNAEKGIIKILKR